MLVTEPLTVSKPVADWDLPNPHVVTVDVVESEIDAYQHVNNSVYLSWLDRVAWSHSALLLPRSSSWT